MPKINLRTVPLLLSFIALSAQAKPVSQPGIMEELLPPQTEELSEATAKPTGRTDVLLFTAETREAISRAEDVRRLLTSSLLPFNLLNLNVQIHTMSPEEMRCTDGYPNHRLLTCGFRTNAIATRLKRRYNARRVLIITHHTDWQGSGGFPYPVASAGLSSLMAVHEMMHVMGFRDEYVERDGYSEARPNREGYITIMGADTDCIPKSYWAKIARALGRRNHSFSDVTETACN